MVEQFRELCAEERRDDGRRCLVATQAVGVGSTHDGGLQQTVMTIYRHQRLDNERHEAQVLLGRLAWGMQQDRLLAIGYWLLAQCRQAPVVMLT